MAFRDHHSRAATPEYKSACDAMGWDAGLTMSRYLVEGREDESFPEWKARVRQSRTHLQRITDDQKELMMEERDAAVSEYEEAKERIQRMLGRAF